MHLCMALSAEDIMSIWEGPESPCNASVTCKHRVHFAIAISFLYFFVYFEIKNDHSEKGSIAQLSVQVINSQTVSGLMGGGKMSIFYANVIARSHQGVFYLANQGYRKLLFPCWENGES